MVWEKTRNETLEEREEEENKSSQVVWQTVQSIWFSEKRLDISRCFLDTSFELLHSLRGRGVSSTVWVQRLRAQLYEVQL